jgi:ribosomal protein S18 acetylase RimI-like enzyme
MKIRSFKEDDYQAIVKIFFDSSEIKFSSENSKKDFQYKYLDFYLQNGFCFVALKDDNVLAYICGLYNILDYPEVFNLISYLEKFNNFYNDYPCVLHINASPNCRGLGIGSKLINYLIDDLNKKSIKGVHLITSKDSRNVRFYLKNEFSNVDTIIINGKSLVLLGKIL